MYQHMKTISLSFSFICVLILLSTTALCQSCSNTTILKNAFIGNVGKKGTDGLVHITYAFTDSSGNAITNPVMQSTFDAAFSAWNAYASVTGVKFDLAPTGTLPDLSITGDNASGDNCIGSDPGGMNISYGPDWAARFSDPSKASQSTIGVEHEIGHILGMADNIPSVGTSIMNKGSSCSAGSNATGLKPNDPTSTSDTATAGSCVQVMIKSHNSSPSSGGGDGDGSGGGASYGCFTSYASYSESWQDGDGNVHVNVYDTVEEVVCF